MITKDHKTHSLLTKLSFVLHEHITSLIIYNFYLYLSCVLSSTGSLNPLDLIDAYLSWV